MKTSAPASTKPRAIALPRPLLPPVTSATRPFRLNNVLCIDLPLRLANKYVERLNVRAGFPPVNQPVPRARKGCRKAPLDSFRKNRSILQDHLKHPPLDIKSFLLHRKTLHTPLFTGAVVRPSRNNGITV